MDLFCKSVMQDMSFRGVDQASIICLQLLRSYISSIISRKLGLEMQRVPCLVGFCKHINCKTVIIISKL